MKVSELIQDFEASLLRGNADAEVQGICCDSRKLRPGELFIALKGCKADGGSFVDAAFEKGAVAAVSASRLGLAQIADRFFGHPSGEITLVGITGTNGKTTTVTLLYKLFSGLGFKCGLLSTIANYVADCKLEAVNTTSDPITTNSLLRRMADEGCRFCFMEVSSIGMEQDRVSCLDFDMGIFSNLTHDHLDYHGTFAEYLRCKKLFFDRLGKNATALVNIDDRNGKVMVQNCVARVVEYSCRSAADHCCRIMEQSMEGMLLKIDGTEVWTRLIGAHNAYNLLAIYSCAVELGFDKEDVLLQLSSLESAKGRLETIHGPSGKSVVIDYAHTPDALENVLSTLKEVCPGKELVCLFGCGGDRDSSKRPEMGAVAEKYADRIVLTADNSRSESTEEIMAQIREGMSPAGRGRTLSIASREEAIRTALMLAGKGACILLAGKGHEDYQIIGNEKLHFDEREIVEKVFKELC